MQRVIDYLVTRYDPEVLILYGSYADGTNNAHSDVDALIMADVAEEIHDVSMVDGVQLDVFLYPSDADLIPADFPQLYHCRILIDRKGRGAQLRNAVVSYIDSCPAKPEEEIRTNISWCEKMVQRIKRKDAEGFFRWHWVLCDSLEFYCDIRGRFYFGPKKTLLWMQMHDPEAFSLYFQALSQLDADKLEAWVDFLKSQL